MQLLLVAPPGAGKGTQAAKLASHYDIAHLSSGELLRQEVAAGTPTGQIAADYQRRGDLVPDQLVLEVLTGPILEATRGNGYVLDGFPRTLPQAEEAYRLAQQLEGVELQAVIHLEVSRPELRRRLLVRTEGDTRDDGTDAVIEHRLQVFDLETAPLLGFYGRRGLVVSINGEQPVELVFADITTAVDRLAQTRP